MPTDVQMPAQAPPDLGTGSGGLMQIGTTQVDGQSGTPGANLPVDAIELAGSMIAQGKADQNQTFGAERRLDGFDGVGGGGGGATANNANANNANANNNNGQTGAQATNVSQQQGGLGAQSNVQNASVGSGPGGQDPRSVALSTSQN
jgi:hypothetical protein